MPAALLSLAALLLGVALVLADRHLAGTVLRRTADPEAGAATARALGLALLVAGGVGFLAWTP